MNNKNLPPPPTLPPNFTASEKFCLLHKGELSEENYTCPKCKTKYCLKCAKKAKIEGKSCVKCKQLILV